MKRLLVSTILGLALVAVYGFGLIPSLDQSAACADCNGEDASVAKQIYDKFNEECKKIPEGQTGGKACFVLNTYNKILPTLKKLAKDNRFGPGDRILFVGEGQAGNLIAGANRTFQAGAPSAKDTMKVTVTKTNGNNGALIKICAIDASGNLTRVGTINFPDDKSTGAKSADIKGIEGKIVRVEVASFGGVAGNFKYALATEQ